ncbi:hypothetical protein KL930_003704 [Ogataea haglerorum]|uniref:Uncharacterized protein n=1 Tax=Ogataea haglerorum TaxID=1937702 RepID=A0ABQ7RER0_9ASCO|nr:uncharacterized protein KL911_003296 [Ogataea haglerorum]KAG7695707.1 hypothetical protein KL915_003097 [Ogataea haglerorum]KAG7696036.1 hypothetical protein KL951_003561 [Ogataea haglerorum]KAG7705540.1 hypothetical protein KL914_003378 [Ogataea haglerorum]KAG7707443.1 hypothetical protein KL950_003103 [Ogataea haglerorum]KAG7718261.1 hypothetical protein KL913_002256 [Ogataea haglerorum]
MSIVSRKEVFGDSESTADASHEYAFDPGIEFEIVDVADVVPGPQPEAIETFPLFSGAADVQVSLEEKEYVYELGKENTERPRSYYYAEYSSQEKAEFQQAAVDGQEIVSQSRNIIPSKYKLVVLDRQEYTQRPATTTKKAKRTPTEQDQED